MKKAKKLCAVPVALITFLIISLALAGCSSSEVNVPASSTENGATPNAAPSAASSVAPSPEGELTLTLYGDMPEETRTQDITLPLEGEPASPSLIAFTLADELSAWTGLGFSLNDVSFGEDSITVDWSKDSTLIAGLGDREMNEELRPYLYDAVSLNWFMMDSLATTLKNNMDIATVYYCSEGGSVTFPNPEDMAAQGLPELPADQPYEGSAFFISHAGGRGDLVPMDRDQAEVIVMDATKDAAQSINEHGGKAVYIYTGEDEVNGFKAWCFALGTDTPEKFTTEHHYAVDENGALWELDILSDWQLLS